MTTQKQSNIFSYYKAEKEAVPNCSIKDCTELGKHKVIPNPRFPQQVVYMCLEHTKKHNQTVNYFKDMGVKEIEEEIRSDTVWRLPTWPLRGDYHKLFTAKDFFNFFDDPQKLSDEISAPPFLPKEVEEAMKVMGVSFPIELKQFRKIYKNKVKEHHPDLNAGRKSAEEELKKINIAYKVIYNFLADV